MDINEMDRIAAKGASALKSHHPKLKGEKWRLNPHPPGSVKHELWVSGYEAEAELQGTVGQDI